MSFPDAVSSNFSICSKNIQFDQWNHSHFHIMFLSRSKDLEVGEEKYGILQNQLKSINYLLTLRRSSAVISLVPPLAFVLIDRGSEPIEH